MSTTANSLKQTFNTSNFFCLLPEPVLRPSSDAAPCQSGQGGASALITAQDFLQESVPRLDISQAVVIAGGGGSAGSECFLEPATTGGNGGTAISATGSFVCGPGDPAGSGAERTPAAGGDCGVGGWEGDSGRAAPGSAATGEAPAGAAAMAAVPPA